MVVHIAPCTQQSPRCTSIEVFKPAFQAASQAAMAESTAAGLLLPPWSMEPAGKDTLARPTSLPRGVALGSPTVDSAMAMVFEVPSITALSVLLCCQANNPVVFTLAMV